MPDLVPLRLEASYAQLTSLRAERDVLHAALSQKEATIRGCEAALAAELLSYDVGDIVAVIGANLYQGTYRVTAMRLESHGKLTPAITGQLLKKDGTPSLIDERDLGLVMKHVTLVSRANLA